MAINDHAVEFLEGYILKNPEKFNKWTIKEIWDYYQQLCLDPKTGVANLSFSKQELIDALAYTDTLDGSRYSESPLN